MIGDTQKNPTVTGKIAKLMWERRPNFVVHLGDVVDNGPDKKEWVDELFGPCRELFARVPVYPCIGNHEKNHAHYYRYFSLPKPEYYYSFRYGNAEFFVARHQQDGRSRGGEQYEWLDKALAASDAKWKFCYHHHPATRRTTTTTATPGRADSTAGDAQGPAAGGAVREAQGGRGVQRPHPPVRADVADPRREGGPEGRGGVRHLRRRRRQAGGLRPDAGVLQAQGRVDYHFCYVTVHGGTFECKAFDHEGRLFDTFALNKE